MKKNLLILFYLTFAGTAYSQVVISESDINPNVGEILYQTTDSLIDQTIVVTPPGSGQTWDFSALNNHNVDTLTFVNPSTAPGASNFGTATHCVATQAEGSITHAFLRKQTNNLSAIGFVFDNPFNPGTDLPIKINPPQRVINFPSQVGGGTNVSYYRFRVQFSGSDLGITQFDSIRITNSGKRLMTPDADGILITPEGSNNVLRIETISHDTSRIEGKTGFLWFPLQTNYDTTYTYDFWKPGTPFPVLTLGYDHINQEVTSASWLTNNPLGIKPKNNSIAPFALSPNPTTGLVKLVSNQLGTISIMDAIGRKVYNSEMQEGLNILNLLNLGNGVYQVVVRDKDFEVLSSQKIVINK